MTVWERQGKAKETRQEAVIFAFPLPQHMQFCQGIPYPGATCQDRPSPSAIIQRAAVNGLLPDRDAGRHMGTSHTAPMERMAPNAASNVSPATRMLLYISIQGVNGSGIISFPLPKLHSPHSHLPSPSSKKRRSDGILPPICQDQQDSLSIYYHFLIISPR